MSSPPPSTSTFRSACRSARTATSIGRRRVSRRSRVPGGGRGRDQEQQRRPIHSIFFGGGTPSLMSAEQVEQVLTAAAPRRSTCCPTPRSRWSATLAMPTSTSCAGFRRPGANRLSFGIQSLDDAFLKLLGRRHDSATSAPGGRLGARQAGFQLQPRLHVRPARPDRSTHWQPRSTRRRRARARPPVVLPAHRSTSACRWAATSPRGRLVLPVDDDLAEMYRPTRDRLADGWLRAVRDLELGQARARPLDIT